MERLNKANKNVDDLEILKSILQMKRLNAIKFCTLSIHKVSL